jgi:Response regulator containing CheY-like receiver, AAA-type ATPase, and DNA-binding domains
MGNRIQTAMIIDDDEDLSHILAILLEKRKLKVMEVHSLTEAEDYLSFLKPTVIFLDNSFPEGLGVNFIKYIRSADKDIKIIMMTADSSRWVEEKAIDEGVNCFLKKPLDIKRIEQALEILHI